MSIRVALNHRTSYKYDRRVTLSPHIIRLRPAVHSRTPIEAYSLKITPEPHFLNWQQDAFGNFLARIDFPEQTDHFSFEVDLIADMVVVNPFDFFLDESAEEFPFEYDERLLEELVPYLKKKESGPLLNELVESIDMTKKRTVDFLVMVNTRLQDLVDYSVRMEPGVQSCEETLKKKVGSCRDSAYLAVQLFRHLGLAARFASGYLVQLKQDQESLDGPSGAVEDFTDLHAWTEVYVPGAGWIGLDPTSGLFAGEGHIPLACTPEPESAAPVVGGMGECEVLDFEFSNTVTRLHEDPRVTKPYKDSQWEKVNELGDQVDKELMDGDVRLTMGGEPTFISIDDMEGAEWNISADSPRKRDLALELLQRLQKKYAPQGLRYYGEGKWYPGEPLPRWSYEIIWRKDGQLLWREQEWLDQSEGKGDLSVTDAGRFASELARALDVDTACVKPAFEDKFYYLWYEASLPVSEDSTLAGKKDPIERLYLENIIKDGIDSPKGYVLPLKYDNYSNEWTSVRWKFRREELYLIPGGSAIGLRLPLASLGKEAEPSEDEAFIRRSPLEAAPELADPTAKYAKRLTSGEEPTHRSIVAPNSISTAISFEVRNGKLFIFFPPVDSVEQYIDLLDAIQAVASHLKMKVVIEGYEMPYDNRIDRIKVTPDPGVIEVNVHPLKTWPELVDMTTHLYEEARLSRLGTEKFMIDGRHTGTGGGNHVTLGGTSPADSPFLRRPSLLRSFITYWQHHPGLSYLFSGTFIGPTSQAPRVDEGRVDRLFELDIAFQQLPETSDSPWLVDRVLRNMLTDLTGNTHRSEFCIDKLYSPDSSTGRLGIVELRAFEMPPHAQMSLVQQLLMRIFVAKFWKDPYKGKMVRWDTELHDRFLLPHFVWDDMGEVVKDLKESGYNFELDWLDAFFEFRFPVFGRVQYKGIGIEIRMALEPWNVLGEESSSSGTARYVDSSVERIQVKVSGLTRDRHILICNGRRLPLRSTGVKGEFVAGVRYKAWDPWSALHPTIGIQTPLTFDVIDTWNKRSVGGCVYHVGHPGGRSYETIPVNSYEAESRRNSRFWQQGHTPGTLDPEPEMPEPRAPQDPYDTTRSVTGVEPGHHRVIPAEEPSGEFPTTLDLRVSPRPH